MAWKKSLNAVKPPAEATMPTSGVAGSSVVSVRVLSFMSTSLAAYALVSGQQSLCQRHVNRMIFTTCCCQAGASIYRSTLSGTGSRL
jgi:hypothetical protein